MRVSIHFIACSQRQMNMHMQIIQLHIMSIHPANKAAEHLISSQL